MQQLFYSDVVPLNSERHRDWSVRTVPDFRFARNINAAPLTAVEFDQAGAEYPIVFAGGDEAVLPVAVLGVQDGENLNVGPEGAWLGRYVPAFVRRYPFVFSSDAEGKTLTLCVDEAFEGANQTGVGERLFDSEGAQTQYTRNVLRFLQDYQAHFQRTQAFCKRLTDLDLLQPMQAQFNLSSGEKKTLGGFRVVDRAKLKALSDADVMGLFQRDELECLYLHLASLRHFNDLLERLAKPQTAPETAPTEEHA
ncbi:MAG: SapC family protein [Roseovarius sp.]